MKNPYKHQPTPKDHPSQAPMTPEATLLEDLTDADLQHVQGGVARDPANGLPTGQRSHHQF
jgi:hypothetical protein